MTKLPVQQKDQDKPEDPRLKKLQGMRLIIATPCYGGQVTERYAQSMFNLVSVATKYGVSLGYLTLANESLITRGRNELVSTFMKQTTGTHLMFIDADISFEPNDIIRMLLADEDIVAGAYPLKTLDWNAASGVATLYPNAGPDETMAAAIQYVINVHKPDPELVGKQVDVQIVNGLLEVWDAGTGFMLMKREVIESMITAYPETRYFSDKDMTVPEELRERYALFDTMIDDDLRYLSEDYTFCRRWQNIGGKIHLDINTVLDHIGTMTFQGRSVVKPKE